MLERARRYETRPFHRLEILLLHLEYSLISRSIVSLRALVDPLLNRRVRSRSVRDEGKIITDKLILAPFVVRLSRLLVSIQDKTHL